MILQKIRQVAEAALRGSELRSAPSCAKLSSNPYLQEGVRGGIRGGGGCTRLDAILLPSLLPSPPSPPPTSGEKGEGKEEEKEEEKEEGTDLIEEKTREAPASISPPDNDSSSNTNLLLRVSGVRRTNDS